MERSRTAVNEDTGGDGDGARDAKGDRTVLRENVVGAGGSLGFDVTLDDIL